MPSRRKKRERWERAEAQEAAERVDLTRMLRWSGGRPEDAEAWVVVSYVALELTPRADGLTREQRCDAIPSVHRLWRVAEGEGLAAARRLAERGVTDPPSVWWCGNAAEAEGVLDGVYRLLRERGRADGYEAGVAAGLGGVMVWVDW